jgi:hypothetical protein
MIGKTLMGIMLTLTISVSYAQDYDAIRAKLEAISDSSYQLRKNVMPVIKKYGADSPQMDSLNSIILSHDSASLAGVTLILEKYGWLGISKVGKRASQALYLTIQHAQENLLREKYFPLLKASAIAGESNLADMATMKDRILIEKGRKQIYGTQYKVIDGERVVLPIKNEKKVNRKRKEVGL